MERRFVHIVWSPATGPIRAYENPTLASDHARTMVGVNVATLLISSDLPEDARADIASDHYDGDDITPVIDAVPVPIRSPEETTDTIVVSIDDVD